jgi:hypothetical protein
MRRHQVDAACAQTTQSDLNSQICGGKLVISVLLPAYR